MVFLKYFFEKLIKIKSAWDNRVCKITKHAKLKSFMPEKGLIENSVESEDMAYFVCLI